MLKSIFYARFHPEKGSTVLHQVPEGSVIPCPPSPTAQTPLFDYKSISDYIIPRREFCDRLVSIVTPSPPEGPSGTGVRHRIVGFPVCIHDDEKYSRNDFIFNFCLVLDEEAPFAAYASVIRKVARLFRNLEEQDGFLSREEGREGVVLAGEVGYGGGSKVYALCEMILEDLNCYCECMIPIDESNQINLKLFPTRPPPPPIHVWHVPLSLVSFASLSTNTWDLTVQRLLPFINGINSVARIATLADTDLTLTRRAISHLLFYGCVCLLDIFQFSAVYAATAEIGVFFADEAMQDECRYYISSPHAPFGKGPIGMGSKARGGSKLNPAHEGPVTTSPDVPSRATVLTLYASLRQGLTVRDWCLAHATQLVGIDVRRFITFGKIKGFIYRCHKYAVAMKGSGLDSGVGVDLDDPIASARMQEKAWRKAAMSSGWQTPKHQMSPEEQRKVTLERLAGENGGNGDALDLEDAGLARYLDGLHCLDEISTEMKMSEREVVKRLKGIADVAFIYR